MSASLIASFISFLITGIYTYWIVSFDLDINPGIKWALFFAILANAFYFFYVEALTESDEATKIRIRKVSKREWVLRIINQTILFSLWFLLIWSMIAFAIGLVLLYILFIYWDRFTGEYKEDRNLYYTDIGGLILTSAFLLVTYLGMNGNMISHEPFEFSAKLYSQDSVNTLVQFSAKDTTAIFTESYPAKDSVNLKAVIYIEEIPSSKNGQLMQPLVDTSLQFYWGGCVFLYLLLPIVSLIINKFKLFDQEYWKRDKIV